MGGKWRSQGAFDRPDSINARWIAELLLAVFSDY